MLWLIDGTNTFILGSAHLGNIKLPQLSDIAEQIYVKSERIVFEADMDMVPNQSPMLLPNSGLLADVIPASLYAEVTKKWIGLGIPESYLLHLRPFFAAVQLTMTKASQSGYSPEFGVDRHIWERATLDQKKKLNFETHSDQLQRMAEFPLDEQISSLENITAQDDLGLAELSTIVGACNKGDIQYLASFLQKRHRLWPAISESMISERNRKWAPSIAEVAKDKSPCIIVLGALHLVGPVGLPALLERHGLKTALLTS